MRSSRKKVLRWCGIGVVAVVLLFVLWVSGMLLAEKLYGGPHVVLAGKSHGFEIGMTKSEVFRRYKELNETANIRAYGADSGPGYLALEGRPSELKFRSEFESSDHWMAYRRKWPIDFQEFYFDNEKLTNITTYIRFYETP
jgi:hypothetical protein